jgi:hypothetical protein
MPTPIILIGIGSSGLYVLENVQRFYYESYKVNKPKHVEYLYIDTIEDTLVGITQEPNEISKVYISLNQIELMVDEIKRTNNNTEWLPPKEQLVDAGKGSGGIRALGRLALWGNNNEGNNFQKVINAITYAHAKISSYTQSANNATLPVVFITGSLAGGTGSGICVDMAYLVKYLIRDVRFVYGLFLLPKIPSIMRGFEVMYANSLGAMKDIETYSSPEFIYKEEWPNGYHAVFSIPPFELVQYISQDFCDGSPAIRTLDGLYKIAGLYLFLNIAGMCNRRIERMVDSRGCMQMGKYGTFGLAGIQYPIDQIQEYVAAELSKELLERWLDERQYINNNEPRPIEPSLIQSEVFLEWSHIIETSFDILDNIEGRDLISEMETEAFKINKNELNESKDQYLFKLFSSKHDRGFYIKVQNNVQAVVNEIIDQIHDLIVRKLDQSENLEYARMVLESVVKAIDSDLNRWESMALPEKSELWENLLRDQVNIMTKKQSILLFNRTKVLKDQILNTFKLLKIHLIIPKLIDIRQHIVGESISLRSNQSGKELPKLSTTAELIDKILEVIGKKESGYISISQRINDIDTDIKDETIPILRIYPTGSFTTEKENAIRSYKNWDTKKYPSRQDFTDQKLWEYFSRNINKLKTTLYRDMLIGYRRRIMQCGCIQDYDVGQYLIQHADEGIKMAKRSLSPLISLKDIVFSYNPVVPRFIAGASATAIELIIQKFREWEFQDFSYSRSVSCEVNGLNNLIVFFDEKGYYNPMTHLSYIKQMENAYNNVPSNIVDNITPKVWRNYRKVYFPVNVKENPEKNDDKVRKNHNESVVSSLSNKQTRTNDSDKDHVDCSVFSVPEVKCGESILIQVFVHLIEKYLEAEALAKEFDEDATRRGLTSLDAEIARGTKLSFELSFRDIQIENPVNTIKWQGRTTQLGFEINIPENYASENLIGKLMVSQDSIPLGHIIFKIKVLKKVTLQKEPRKELPLGIAKRYENAFISYASKDRSEVLRRVQMLSVTRIKYFQDILNLEPGDRWERELYKKIDDADVFFLFWSKAASESEWVLKEIQYALNRKSGDEDFPPEIIPVIIEKSAPNPPVELKDIHFNDKIIYFIDI